MSPLNYQWPNLKNLSGGLNLSRGLNMVGSSNVSIFRSALNLNRVLADLNRGSNSLNSISGCTDIDIRKFEFGAKTQFLYIGLLMHTAFLAGYSRYEGYLINPWGFKNVYPVFAFLNRTEILITINNNRWDFREFFHLLSYKSQII